MKLTRRGFIQGIAAAFVTQRLPTVKPDPALERRAALMKFIGSAREVTHASTVAMPVSWTQVIYGAGIVYAPRKRIIMENV